MNRHPLRIAIVGGGPAGLSLGVLLHKRGIPFTLFELRQQLTDEQLGKPAGSLDLHEGAGLSALRDCGLLDEFYTLTGDCAQVSKIADKDGNVIFSVDRGSSGNRPEISRHKLVKLLLSHLPAGAIKWNHKLFGAQSLSSGGCTEVELDFGRNGRHTFDLVVGADGAWSKVRPMLSTEKPRYAGMQIATLNIRQVTASYPQLAEMIGTGSYIALGNKHGISSQRSVGDSTRIYVFISTEDEHFAATNGFNTQTPAQAKDKLFGNGSLFANWAPEIKQLVAGACDDETADNPETALDIRALYKLPAGHTWAHRPGATLIGDAAHLTNPPAGEGVNIAMQDSLLLSRAIVEAYESSSEDFNLFQRVIDPLLEEFEGNMAERGNEMAKMTLQVSHVMFGVDDGAVALTEWFKSFVTAPE